jgi:hypothetical protein
VLLVVLWLLGMVSSYTLGGFIHLLLVLAIAVMLVRIIQGRRRCEAAAARRGRREMGPVGEPGPVQTVVRRSGPRDNMDPEKLLRFDGLHEMVVEAARRVRSSVGRECPARDRNDDRAGACVMLPEFPARVDPVHPGNPRY